MPNADRLAWACLLIGVNAGITGPLRLIALARRALRALTAERPDEVSPRNTLLATALPGFDAFGPDTSLAHADALIGSPDPYVQGMGLFLRAAMRDNGGMPSASVADAELAYERFEVAGDHWGMAMTAQAVGHSTRMSGGDRAAAWLARGARHMEALGAAQDARALRLALDVQLALTGDATAERRLREVAVGQSDEEDAAQAALGLAHLARQRGRYEEALAYGDAVIRSVTGFTTIPQPGVLYRVAVAVLYLWAAGDRQNPGQAAHAAALLTAAREEALRSADTPMIGAWALGGAELAAYRGEDVPARELWALGMRVGANLGNVFLPSLSDRLAAALGSEDERRAALAGWQGRPVATTGARIRALMDGLLRPSSGTPAAPTA